MNRAARMREALADGQPKTRAELFRHAGEFYLTNNAASELRKELRPEQDIAQWCVTENGKRVYVYQLVSLREVSGERPETSRSEVGPASTRAGDHQPSSLPFPPLDGGSDVGTSPSGGPRASEPPLSGQSRGRGATPDEGYSYSSRLATGASLGDRSLGERERAGTATGAPQQLTFEESEAA